MQSHNIKKGGNSNLIDCNAFAQKIFGGEIKNHILLFLEKPADGSAKILEGFRKAAEGFKGKILFITLDTSDEDNGFVHFYYIIL
jgi:hypothetical protein